MLIVPASDLHLEFPNADPKVALNFPSSADVIVLAGDIARGENTARIALSLADRFPTAHVVWVAGNHEFYDGNIDILTDRYRALCAGHKRVHFLENNHTDIGNVRFIGCTLWTDFSILGNQDASKSIAQDGISDFVWIRTKSGARFKAIDATQRFELSHQYLKQQLSRSRPESTVVVTHFPPGLATRNPQFDLDPITAYFQANVDDVIDQFQPALWIYGHNHFSNDLYRGATRLVSNQLGYSSEDGRIPSYSAKKIVVLGDNSI
jgi:Icc-related predicted phosphoesterase